MNGVRVYRIFGIPTGTREPGPLFTCARRRNRPQLLGKRGKRPHSVPAGSTPLSLLAFTVTDGRITDITAVVDPAQLVLMDLPDPV